MPIRLRRRPQPDAASAEVLIAGRGLTLEAQGQPVLDHVGIEVRRGEIVTLIGPNGAGKTTLVKVLLGLQRPDRGVVEKAACVRVGYVPQRFAVDPVLPLTVSRFLDLARRCSPAEKEAVLEEVGAPALLARSMHALSGGEIQRVLLARALVRDPNLLVLDEPVQGVDYAGQAELYALIARIRDRRRCGVLLISHDLHLVMAATDQVVCLNRHVCCSGLPEAVSRHPEYVALFGRRAASELAFYSHRHDHRHGPDGEVVPLTAPHSI